MSKNKISVVFVCMGNICRSPTAEGVFRHLVHQEGLDDWITTDSAGTHAYHIGEQPDHRAQQTARSRGIDLGDLRARKAIENDFHEFDYVLAMDDDNYQLLEQICPAGLGDKLSLIQKHKCQIHIMVVIKDLNMCLTLLNQQVVVY